MTTTTVFLYINHFINISNLPNVKNIYDPIGCCFCVQSLKKSILYEIYSIDLRIFWVSGWLNLENTQVQIFIDFFFILLQVVVLSQYIHFIDKTNIGKHVDSFGAWS